MLKAVVRQPISPPIGATMMKNGASTSTAAGAVAANAKNQQHQQHHEGKEKILPLIRRPILRRLDVYPFLIGYFLLILLDVAVVHYFSLPAITVTHTASAVATILIDILYVTLLVIQLVVFLKCQWDPIWHASVAYRRYKFQPPLASSMTTMLPADVEASVIEQKIQDMKSWTHCLIVPPNPYDAATASTSGGGAAAQTVRPERPGIVPLTLKVTSRRISGGVLTSHVAMIHFRGWIYRYCFSINVNGKTGIMTEDQDGDGHVVDLPMESIWQKGEDEYASLEEISDGEEDGETNETQSAATATFNSTTLTSWEPQFHRLHFPIDLPLQFYSQWQGHDSTSDNSNTTLHSTQQIFGLNQTIIPLPAFLALLTQQLLQPMFLFQLLCVMLWCLDEYWMYAIFTLMTLMLFEAIQAGNRWKSVKRLREEVTGAPEDDGGNTSNASNSAKQRVECYRMGQWFTLPTNQLVVGDIISMVSPSIHNQQQQRNANIRNIHDHQQGCTIPADLLLLSGRAVVNEAMLTGESVPQVKESMEVGEVSDGSVLDLSDGSAHKRCVLFGGTTLMDHHSEQDGNDDEPTSNSNIPSPPNQGLVCFVLRTGFDTIQGSLLRTLAYHAESGGGGNSGGGDGVNAKETFYFLLILLLCALASAATVVQHAWGDVTRNHFKLVLHVIIIITSVIPPELPMELSLAVTTSLGELIKRYQVYCTEPFRIPLAGLVDTCCFDKTGTLTSDEMRLHGVKLPDAPLVDEAADGKTSNGSSGKDDEDLILFDDILSKNKSASVEDDTTMSSSNAIRSLLPRETLRVMVGCQSLATTHVFVPGKAGGKTTVQTELCGDPLEKAVMEGCGFTIHPKNDTVIEKESLGAPLTDQGSIRVLYRFAFSSKLRRMTVLALDTTAAAKEENGGDTTAADADNTTTLWALTKGAPEALKPLLDPASLPADYEQSYLRHMALGRRVLALAYRNLGTMNAPPTSGRFQLSKWKASRENVEQNLIFAGLLIMDSPLKADSARVVKELRAGDQNVVMVTGDAVLTAAEVARRVGIVDASQECTYELRCRDGKGTSSEGREFVFRHLDHSVVGDEAKKEEEELPYTPSNLPKLQAFRKEGKANFCVTGDVLTKLAIHAVEQATTGNSTLAITNDDRAVLNHPAAKSALSNLAPIISVFARHAPRHKEAVIAAFNASGHHTLMCGDGTNDVGALKQAHVGVSIISVPDLEKKQRSANDVISAVKAEEKKERKKAQKKKEKESKGGGSGKVPSATKKPKRSRADRVEKSLQALREAEDEVNFVSLGNASMASPFTSRKTSVRCCTDILQQGRCTLVTMIQIYKILGVQCLVNALVLTKLHQKGVKQGDRQLTAVGIVVSVLFLFVTRGKPLPKLSTQKPPSSVLSKETLLSMTVQFGIHFAAIMAVTFISDTYVDPYDPSIVPDGPFHPNTLNTATFLITVLATINAFLINYRGRPFMEDLTENKLLFRSIQGCYFVLFVCALEVFPPLNQLMQLSPLPSSGPPLFHLEHHEGGGSVDEFGIVHDLLLQAVKLVGFKAMLCVIMCLDTALVSVAEKVIRSVLEA